MKVISFSVSWHYLFRTYYIFDVVEMVLIPELFAFSWKKKKKIKKKEHQKMREYWKQSNILGYLNLFQILVYKIYTYISIGVTLHSLWDKRTIPLSFRYWWITDLDLGWNMSSPILNLSLIFLFTFHFTLQMNNKKYTTIYQTNFYYYSATYTV